MLVVNPTCSMMMRREWPHLLDGADRARAERLAPAVMDVSEFLWSIRNEPRFSTDFKSSPPGGKVAYHAPCHLRAQAIGFKGRDLVRKIPGVTISATVMECCGHDGTFAMTVEGFEPSRRIGQKAFDGMKAADAEVWTTDCPLAAHPVRSARRAAPAAPGDAPRARVPGRGLRREAGGRGAMRRVRREEILDLADLRAVARGDPRRRSSRRSGVRRVHVAGGAHLPLREHRDDPLPGPGDGARRADDAARQEIRHELETYNELLGGRGRARRVAPHRAPRAGGARPQAARVARAAAPPLPEARGRREGPARPSTRARSARTGSRRSSTSSSTSGAACPSRPARICRSSRARPRSRPSSGRRSQRTSRATWCDSVTLARPALWGSRAVSLGPGVAARGSARYS